MVTKVSQGVRLERPLNCPHDIFTVMKRTWHEEPDLRPSFSDLMDILLDIIDNINANNVPPGLWQGSWFKSFSEWQSGLKLWFGLCANATWWRKLVVWGVNDRKWCPAIIAPEVFMFFLSLFCHLALLQHPTDLPVELRKNNFSTSRQRLGDFWTA